MHKKMKFRLLLLGFPAAAGFIVFYIYPFFKSIGYSFIENTFTKRFVWLANYKTVVSNEFFRMAIKNTAIFSIVGVISVVLLALVMSLCLVKLSEKLSFVKSAFVLPYVLPTASIVFVWQSLFSQDWYYTLAEKLASGSFFDVLPLYLLFVWKNIGINIILITAALARLPKDVYEAAALDGASGITKHLKITLPLISPSLFFVIILSFVNSFKIFRESYLYYGTNYLPDSAYMIQNYMNNNFYKLNYQNLSTAVTVFILGAAAVIFIIYKITDRISQ